MVKEISTLPHNMRSTKRRQTKNFVTEPRSCFFPQNCAVVCVCVLTKIQWFWIFSFRPSRSKCDWIQLMLKVEWCFSILPVPFHDWAQETRHCSTASLLMSLYDCRVGTKGTFLMYHPWCPLKWVTLQETITYPTIGKPENHLRYCFFRGYDCSGRVYTS